ncbi:leucyl aminopeptidase [Flavobacterium enshiense DK69]|uniref:Leucyl aminopeptidase n=1 Tax=Flavobacterium enshiense DK69 TaxID=1107311 RepID=V6SEH2_9FLAO|nr:M28 family peptidase [Flavobacterium enshiense]ESU25098.1 leucyl aminopeptidase [Flavobacterium enshiense DK69]KGO97003.1 leucyl aminopeptidase [Flavobacterium enshiense DK69]
MNFFKRKIVLFLLAIGSLQTTTAQTFIQRYADVANQASQANITNNLTQYEALGVKRKGTVALQNTLDWLKNKYLSYGYTAGQMMEDSYSYSGFTCKNLVLTKVGTVYPNTYVIICGHYDSITGTGTNDNGSGTVVLLEVARLLQSIPTEYSIKFINFSGEEDGLYGSQHYVSSVVNGTTPKMDIKLVFNIDEVGGVAGMVNNTITCERDTGSPTSNNAASNTITNELITCVGLYSTLNTFLNYAYASDYMPFENNNEVITGFFEKNESSHRHTATDLLVNMDPVYVYKISKAATGAMMHFAKASATLSNIDYNADFQISFFPNPTKGRLNINLGTLPINNYTFSLIDIQGKQVYKDSIPNAKQIETIDVSRFSKGVYLGVLESEENRITKKIVIE